MTNTPAWLQQVHNEKDRLPIWIRQVLEHPRFSFLHRLPGTDETKPDDGYWRITTTDEKEFRAPTLGEVCEAFTTLHRLTGNPAQPNPVDKRVEAHIRDLENALVEQGSTLQWVQDVIEGHEVSEFAASFGVVRLVMDLVAEKQALEAELLADEN